jgi:penicillin-binding protein 2
MKQEGRRNTVFTRRALFLMAAQTGALGVLAAKLYRAQVLDGARYATLADTNRISARLIASPRGRILDRFGQVVAGNTITWRALLLAEETTDLQATLSRFAAIMPLADHDRERIARDLKHSRRFIPVVLHDFLDWDDMARIEVNAPDLPGVIVDAGTTRNYPFGPDMAHVVGYVAPPAEADMGDDPVLALPGMRIGRAGVEKSRDDDLRGEAGEVQMEVNAVGRIIRELARTDGAPGDELGLTIDVGLQKSVLTHLGDESASAVVMDCTNGEVLAMATNPSFDPSLFDSGISQAQWVEWTSNTRTPLINKATAGVYPPGSTFKMAVGLAGMAAGTLGPGDRINCAGYIDVGNVRFHCWKKGGHGSLDLRGGLKNSCDVFFWEVARRVGIDPVAAMAHKFSMGVEPAIDLPGARIGLIPDHAVAAGDLCVAHRHRPRGAAACHAHDRRHDAARGRSRGLAGAGYTGGAFAGGARRHVRGGERSRRLGGQGAARSARHAAGRQDRLGAGAPRFALGTRARAFQFGATALAIPPARAVRVLRAL